MQVCGVGKLGGVRWEVELSGRGPNCACTATPGPSHSVLAIGDAGLPYKGHACVVLTITMAQGARLSVLRRHLQVSSLSADPACGVGSSPRLSTSNTLSVKDWMSTDIAFSRPQVQYRSTMSRRFQRPWLVTGCPVLPASGLPVELVLLGPVRALSGPEGL